MIFNYAIVKDQRYLFGYLIVLPTEEKVAQVEGKIGQYEADSEGPDLGCSCWDIRLHKEELVGVNNQGISHCTYHQHD